MFRLLIARAKAEIAVLLKEKPCVRAEILQKVAKLSTNDKGATHVINKSQDLKEINMKKEKRRTQIYRIL